MYGRQETSTVGGLYMLMLCSIIVNENGTLDFEPDPKYNYVGSGSTTLGVSFTALELLK
jgi:hypothetical protein